jgi:nicotinate-nucleotide adenylyltransferase
MIGILGGTFDPVHFGHLRPALDMQQALGLDEVRLLPCRVPPHRAAPAATPEQRLTMLRLAVHGERGLGIDERELKRAGPSYTVDTLLSLRGEMEGRPVVLMVGMDAFRGLDRWHRWRELVELCHLAVATRPGSTVPTEGELAALVRERRVDDAAALRAAPAGRLIFCPVTQMDVSASRIRALLAADRSPRYLLPAAVLEYIRVVGLYQR